MSTVVPKNPEEFFGSWLKTAMAPIALRFGSHDSPGAVVFRIGERPPLAVRLMGGALEITEGLPEDTIVQVTLGEQDFEPILVRGAELLTQNAARPQAELAVFRALTLDAERVKLIRGVPGSVAFVLAANPSEHRMTLTPGSARINAQSPECTIRCNLQDFLSMQRGEANPFEMMMNGKIQITGDAQIPIALSSLLV